jgi:predicted phage replisome organizer
MENDVKWIKFKVGTFDGMSFKKIKRAKIDGVVNLRDKLTAVWFELLDLGGKVNNNGFLLNDELAFVTYEDIAIALDRTEDEVKMCINWFVNNSMMEILDNVYLISNWSKYQNVEGLEKIREQNRLRQQRRRLTLKEPQQEDVSRDSHVSHALPLISNSISNSLSNVREEKIKDNKVKNKFAPPTLEEIEDYCRERNNKVNPKAFYDYFTVGNWTDVNGNKVKNWKQKIITWEKHNQGSSHGSSKDVSKAQMDELQEMVKNKTSKMFGGGK